MNDFFRLIAQVRNYKAQVILNVLFNILTVFFETISYVILGPFLEILFLDGSTTAIAPEYSFSVNYLVDYGNYILESYIANHGRQAGLVFVCEIVIFVFFFKNFFRYMAQYFIAPLRNGLVHDVRKNLFKKMMQLPLSFLTEKRKGDLISRMTADVIEIEYSILSVIEILIKAPFQIIASLFVMFYISFKLTFFAFGLILVIGFMIGRISKTLKKSSAIAQDRLAVLLALVDEAIGGLRIVYAFNAKKYMEDKFSGINREYRDVKTKVYRRKDLSSPLTEFLAICIIATLLWFGATLVFNGEMEPQTLIIFVMMFYGIISPAKSFSTAIYNIQKGRAALERIDEILQVDPDISNKEKAIVVEEFKEKILFRNLSFSYDGQKNVLQDINLEIPLGKSIAVVGASGAGKSTLADLVPRFRDVSQGAILIDGIDIRDYKLESLRSLMGIVSQDAVLFNDSIYNNITFGLENIDKEAVFTAAKIANAHDFILNSEHGYDTIIGDQGMKLSGGQRQRLTIARAVLRNPAILILDEATSSLDSEAENLVQEALLKLMENRTSIVIAHRLSTIQHCDEIIVLEEGSIIERGNHNELMEQRGAYRKLVDLQML